MLELFIGFVLSLLTLAIGVFLGSSLERRKAKAERLLDIKRDVYIKVFWRTYYIYDLVRELDQFLSGLASVSHLPREKLPETISEVNGAGFLLRSKEFVREITTEYMESKKIDSEEDRLDRFDGIVQGLIDEAFVEVQALGSETDRDICILDFADAPERVMNDVNAARKVLSSYLLGPFSERKLTDVEDVSMQKKSKIWDNRMADALDRLRASMLSDLEGTL